MCNSNMFWNNTWKGDQCRVLCINISEVNLSAFIYRLFHETEEKFSSNSPTINANKLTSEILGKITMHKK